MAMVPMKTIKMAQGQFLSKKLNPKVPKPPLPRGKKIKQRMTMITIPLNTACALGSFIISSYRILPNPTIPANIKYTNKQSPIGYPGEAGSMDEQSNVIRPNIMILAISSA